MPNMTHPEVPVGDISKAVVVGLHGTKRNFSVNCVAKHDFESRDAFDLGRIHNLFDTESSVKITGSKFAYFKNAAVTLEFALLRWALDGIQKRGYKMVMTPDLCKTNIVEACGFQPRDDSCTHED